MAATYTTVPKTFQCKNVEFERYQRMEELVRATVIVSRNKNATRQPTLVTDDAAKLEQDKRQYVETRLKHYNGGLYGVTWSARNIEGFQMWLNPVLAATQPEELEETILHELSHAFVATGTSHDETFRKTLHRASYHWNLIENSGWDVWDRGWKVVEKYTERRANNYLEERYGYESQDEYTQRIADECGRAQRMAAKEHSQLRGVLYERFGWSMAQLGS